MSTIWFTSDFHLSHLLVAKLRFPDMVQGGLSDEDILDKHDGWLKDMWKVVGKRNQSVDGINGGNSPWVEIYGDTSSYYMNPGDTLADVLERLKAIRTAYYIVGDMHPDQRDRWEIGH